MLSFAPHQPTATIAPTESFLYVIDAALRVVLAGPSPVELAEPTSADAGLPPELRAPLAEILATHDFTSEPIARASSPATTALRCMRAAGPASYYMVMARPLPLFEAA